MFKAIHFPGKTPHVLSWEQFLAQPVTPTAGVTASPFSWSRIEPKQDVLIVAPHAGVHPDLLRLFERYWESVPDDWDVITLGAYFRTPPQHIAGHVFRPTEFAQVHGIALRDRARVDRSKGSSIEEVLNVTLRDGSQKIYAIWPNLIAPAAEHFNTFRQLGQHGRMGNQFFQVAATLGAAVRFGYRPQFPTWKTSEILTEHFDQRLDARRISGTYNEPHFLYAPIPPTPNLDMFGVFQSPKYFAGYEELIRQYLRPSAKLRHAIDSRFPQLLSKPTVALHVRRGDYVGLAHGFVNLPVEYYRAAMRLFPSDSHFVAFSDDPAWCREAFKNDGVEVMSGNPGYADLYLMASCRHQIIANSSFSWWAAYLNPNPQKRVVAPAKWFGPALSENDERDLLPEAWIRIG